MDLRKVDIAKEGSLDKSMYKVLLYLIKVIPMVMAFICILNTSLSYCGYDIQLLSYLSSSSVLTILFFYISSYVFRFCAYHRMFMYYNTLVWILNIYDLYIGIPLTDFYLFQLYNTITGMTLFIILYLYVKNNKKSTSENSRQHRLRKF